MCWTGDNGNTAVACEVSSCHGQTVMLTFERDYNILTLNRSE